MERKEQQLNDGLHIEYERPISTHRLYAAVVDFFLAVVLIILFVFAGNAIVKATSFYEENQGTIDNYKIASRLYRYDANDTLQIITKTFLIEGDQSASIIENKYLYALEGNEFGIDSLERVGFFDFCYAVELKNPAELKDFYKEHRDAYDKERLEIMAPNAPKHMFEYVKNDDGSIKYYDDIIYDLEGNQIAVDQRPMIRRTGAAKYEEYINYFYKPFVELSVNSLVRIPTYFECTQKMSTVMLAGLIPAPVILGIFIVYFIPGFIFKRGRKSIGKLIFKMGIIDKDGYSPKIGRYIARCSLILAECILFVPAVISLTMLVFSKKMLTLHDLILKMNIVETREHKIYFDKIDAFIENQKVETKSVDFKNVDLKR